MKNTLFLLLLAGTSVCTGHDLSRYSVIMERSPFGKEPPPSETAEITSPDGIFARQYRLCMLYKNGQGELKAGVVSKVNNKNFFLKVGESDDGLSLVEIRLEEGVAVIRQGGETAQLILEGLGGNPLSAQMQKTAALSPSASVELLGTDIPGLLPHRAGSGVMPEHIRTELTDAAPKQARITVRKTLSVQADDSSGSGIEQTDSGDPVPVPGASCTAEKKISFRAPSTYLVQSVPKRYSPF